MLLALCRVFPRSVHDEAIPVPGERGKLRTQTSSWLDECVAVWPRGHARETDSR